MAGEVAGVATAVLWALSSLAWHLSGRRVGSVAVTTLRSAIAALVLMAVHAFCFGAPWPVDMPVRAQWILVWSGVLGAGVGDLLLFRSFMLIGPRLGMLLLTLAPILATIIAWFEPSLREHLGFQALCGILVTIAGVAWVVTEKSGAPTVTKDPRLFRRGVLLALGGSTCIGFAFVATKLGLRAAGDGQAFPATLVRVAASAVFCIAVLPFLGQTRATMAALRDFRAMKILAGGVIVGPLLGIWLSLVALDWADTGVATTLLGTAPIAMIPITWIAYGERPTARSLIGTLVAVGGGAMLFLR